MTDSVLVTGANGFIGSRLVQLLAERGTALYTSSVVYNRDLLGVIDMPERPTRREDWISWLVVSRQLGGTVYGLNQSFMYDLESRKIKLQQQIESITGILGRV